MKKRRLIYISVLFSLIFLTACKDNRSNNVTQPDISASDHTPTPIVTVTPQPTQTPEPTVQSPLEPVETPVVTEGSWDQIHDYSKDQTPLRIDGNIKNLTLQLGNTPDQLHITWFSRSAEQGYVNFISDTGETLPATVTTTETFASAEYYRNQAVVSGLTPNTSYEYQVGNGQSTSPIYPYETKDMTASSFTFTIGSDPEIGLGDLDDYVYEIHSNDWKLWLNRMKAQNPDSAFILSLGDHVARKDSSIEYDLFLDQTVLYTTPLMPVVGNHDAASGFFGEHFSIPNASLHGSETGNDSDYWFIYGDVLFMVLNNLSACDSIDHQLFIQETIEQNPDTKWRVVVSHYSPVSNVDRYQGAAVSVDDYFDYAELFDIDLFLGGHDHLYTRSFLMTDDDEFLSSADQNEFVNPEAALYVIFSTSTSSLYRDPDNYPWAAKSLQTWHPQISQATVTENSFTITTYEANTGTLLDSFTIYKD